MGVLDKILDDWKKWFRGISFLFLASLMLVMLAVILGGYVIPMTVDTIRGTSDLNVEVSGRGGICFTLSQNREFRVFSIPGQQMFLDTGMDIYPGDIISLKATGCISTGIFSIPDEQVLNKKDDIIRLLLKSCDNTYSFSPEQMDMFSFLYSQYKILKLSENFELLSLRRPSGELVILRKNEVIKHPQPEVHEKAVRSKLCPDADFGTLIGLLFPSMGDTTIEEQQVKKEIIMHNYEKTIMFPIGNGENISYNLNNLLIAGSVRKKVKGPYSLYLAINDSIVRGHTDLYHSDAEKQKMMKSIQGRDTLFLDEVILDIFESKLYEFPHDIWYSDNRGSFTVSIERSKR